MPFSSVSGCVNSNHELSFYRLAVDTKLQKVWLRETSYGYVVDKPVGVSVAHIRPANIKKCLRGSPLAFPSLSPPC